MRMNLTGPNIQAEAHRFRDIAQSQGRSYSFMKEATLAPGVEVRLQDQPHEMFSGPFEPAHPGLDQLVSFHTLERGSQEYIQVQVDYEFMKDGSIRREVHENAWSGNVVEDTTVDKAGKIVAHHATDGLSAASMADLQEWNVAY